MISSSRESSHWCCRRSKKVFLCISDIPGQIFVVFDIGKVQDFTLRNAKKTFCASEEISLNWALQLFTVRLLYFPSATSVAGGLCLTKRRKTVSQNIFFLQLVPSITSSETTINPSLVPHFRLFPRYFHVPLCLEKFFLVGDRILVVEAWAGDMSYSDSGKMFLTRNAHWMNSGFLFPANICFSKKRESAFPI